MEELIQRKNKVDQERFIRRNISRQIFNFLNEICIPGPQGIYSLGAFLIFSSGLSYGGTKSNTEIKFIWDKIDMSGLFRLDLKR